MMRSFAWLCLLWFGCLLLPLATPWLCATAVGQEDGDAVVAAMEAAMHQWLHDVEFACRYTYRMGEAESMDAGLSGDWSSVDDSKSFGGELSKGLGKVRMSIVYSGPPVLLGKSGDNASYTNVSVDEIVSTDIALHYSPEMGGSDGMARIMARKRLEGKGAGLGPYDAGVATKRRLTPLAIDGNEIGSYFSSNGNTKSTAVATVYESTAEHMVIRVRFSSGAYQVTKDVNFNLTLKHPVVQEVRTLMDNGAGSRYESISRGAEFVDVEGGPIATLVRSATSGSGPVRVTEWSAVGGGMRSPTAQDFLVPIARNTKVRGVRNTERFMTNGMLDIAKVRLGDISNVYEDELAGSGAEVLPEQTGGRLRFFFLGGAILLVGLIALVAMRKK